MSSAVIRKKWTSTPLQKQKWTHKQQKKDEERKADILPEVQVREGEMIANRRHLHQFPELKYEEVKNRKLTVHTR